MPSPALPAWMPERDWLASTAQMVLRNKWIPHSPTIKQMAFLGRREPEVMLGGAAGGGKSDGLLMAALMFADVPSYTAMLFRRTYADLALPGALMDRANEWLQGTKAKWSAQDKRWTFPSGATLGFGYLEAVNDHYRYQGMEAQMIGVDELTQFEERQYRYLFSRLRRLQGSNIPIRMRSATNPGGVGHQWVKERFLSESSPDRVFVPSKLIDNHYLDQEQYRKSLERLDPFTRAQLLEGDWSDYSGGMFRREWFGMVDEAPVELNRVRYWDLAATEPKKGKDPDWTAGVLMGRHKDGMYYILDARHVRTTPQQVENLVRNTAEHDGLVTEIVMEEEGGASGKSLVDYYTRLVLAGYKFAGDKPTGPKVARAQSFSSMAEAGNVKIVRGSWTKAFLDEVELFPLGTHDDLTDAAAGAFNRLALTRRHVLRMY